MPRRRQVRTLGQRKRRAPVENGKCRCSVRNQPEEYRVDKPASCDSDRLIISCRHENAFCKASGAAGWLAGSPSDRRNSDILNPIWCPKSWRSKGREKIAPNPAPN